MFILNALRLVQAGRAFSATAASHFPKLKSHSGAKKRWKALANGQFKRAQAGHQHLNEHKRPSRKNRLAQTTYSSTTQRAKLHKLLPYGS
ncbi:ribosomal protein L35 [Fomitiporia mediterranea MF3/22]|uniref:ribosomal protein L35 n=1 Tax=Fomitiporia mediterranea (strain MF3/22) TaxID=694068 RepID=UPI00044092E5|nr:ribosomal protein L35 [Fomitiporia mediterranea MF3/22]EJC98050.1 ribosomal protein L35 [Fomitiporia mediterranea MF3/22]